VLDRRERGTWAGRRELDGKPSAGKREKTRKKKKKPGKPMSPKRRVLNTNGRLRKKVFGARCQGRG